MFIADELRKLKELLDDGVLTQSEFEKQKSILLNQQDDPNDAVQNVPSVSYDMQYYTIDNNINSYAYDEPALIDDHFDQFSSHSDFVDNNFMSGDSYDLILKSHNGNKDQVAFAVQEIMCGTQKGAITFVENLPKTLCNQIEYKKCLLFKMKLESAGATCVLIPSNMSKQIFDSDIDELQIPVNHSKTTTNQIACPRCKSTSISTNARGVNWTWGLIGASKTVNRCANCGYTWKPSTK